MRIHNTETDNYTLPLSDSWLPKSAGHVTKVGHKDRLLYRTYSVIRACIKIMTNAMPQRIIYRLRLCLRFIVFIDLNRWFWIRIRTDSGRLGDLYLHF